MTESSPATVATEHSVRKRVPLIQATSRSDLICSAALLLVFLALWVPRLTGPINFRWDASTYYILGTALAEGKGYRLLNEPGEIQAVQYPPLLPMFVAAVQRTIGTHAYFKVGSVLRFAYLIFSALFLLMTYILARQFFSPQPALLVGVITALSFSSFIGPSDVLYADLPFAVVAIGFLVVQQNTDRPLFSIASGAFAVAAYLLRTAGIALLVAWVAESFFRRHFRQAALRAAISAVPVLLWQGYVWKVTHSDEYHHLAYSYQRAAYNYPNVTYGENSRLIAPFQPELGRIRTNDLAKRLARNVVAVPIALGESAVIPSWFVPFLSRGLRNLHLSTYDQWSQLLRASLYVGLFAVGLLGLIGAILIANSRRWFVSLYFAVTLGLVIMTPWEDQFWRYLASMTPLSLIFVFVTISALRSRLNSVDSAWRKTAGVALTIVPVVAILLVQAAVAVHVFRSRSPVSYYDATGQESVLRLLDYRSEWHALDPAFEWIRRYAPADAVIATTVPHLAYLRTEHKAVLPPFERDSDKAIHLLDEVPVTYLVLDQFKRPGISERYAAPLVAAKPTEWQLVFSVPGGKSEVYERKR